jgi:hypothetical protein
MNWTLLRGHLSYKTTFSLSHMWPLNTGLTLHIKTYPQYLEIGVAFINNLNNTQLTKKNRHVISKNCHVKEKNINVKQ